VVGEVVVVRLQIDEVVSAEWSDCINWLSSGTDLIVREIDDRVLDAGSSDGLDQEPAVTDIVLVVNGESKRVLREHCVLRPEEECFSRLYLAVQSRLLAHLIVGAPDKLASWKAVYQTGNI
jgi:hypothetical protein